MSSGAKLIQVGNDGMNWDTLPGNTGTFTETAGTLDDTIYGQEWKSSEDGILSWKVDANAIYKGISGYLATIKKAGSSTPLTVAPTTQLGSSKSYQITDITKQVLDTAITVVVWDGSTDVSSDVLSIDYLMGTITFKPSYTPVAAITIHSAHYLPLTAVGKAQTWELKQTADTIETTSLAVAQANGGYSTFEAGLRMVTLSLKGFYDVTQGLRAILDGREVVIIEINPDGAGKSLCRGFYKATQESQQGNVGALEEEDTDFALQVPSANYNPFNWQHSSDSTLSPSIQLILANWLAGTTTYINYLYDGVNGITGQGILTDVSISGGLNALNTFTCSLQGSGVYTPVGTG